MEEKFFILLVYVVITYPQLKELRKYVIKMDGFQTGSVISEPEIYKRYVYEGRAYPLALSKFKNVAHACLLEINRPELTEYIHMEFGEIPHFFPGAVPFARHLTKKDLALIEKAMFLHFQTLSDVYRCSECESAFQYFGISHESGKDFRTL